MKQRQGRLGRQRTAVLIVGLVSVLTMPMPAQAGLGDLIDDLLAPVNDVPIVGDTLEPTVQTDVDPLVTGVLNPIAGSVVDPIVDQVVAPVVTSVVAPLVTPVVDAVAGAVAPPVVEEVPPTVQETIPTVLPTVEETIPTVPATGSSPQGSTGIESRPPGVSLSLEVAPPWNSAPVATPPTPTARTTRVQSLEVAAAVQTALIARAPLISNSHDTREVRGMVATTWLDGLTGWLRDSADGLGALLALPVRLLALLARALLTAGSGLIAPLSMLLALTAYLVKDRRWTRTSLTAAR